MSGIDEVGSRGIPQCPNCGDKTSYWLLRNKWENDIGYLNYDFEYAKDNGEFNMESSMELVMDTTIKMICSRCRYEASEQLLKDGLAAYYKNMRRYPELVRN